jgi:mono/diheme cytochrome c family protein
MSATSRLGVLLLLAACGGGDRTGKTDTTGMVSNPTPGSEQPAAVVPDTTGGGAARPTNDTVTGRATAAPRDSARAPTKSTKSSSKAGARMQDTTKTADTTKAAGTAKPTAAPAGGGGQNSPQQIALGDSIFHGQVAGGTCTACHGQDAKGTAVAPNLTDTEWLNGDGSYQFIVSTVTTGVPQPKQHPAPMPPKGGATLSDEQVKAVAAYVYSLSHKS